MGKHDMREKRGPSDHQSFLDATLPFLDVVCRIAGNLSPDAAQAEDLVQETYLRAFARFATHRGDNTRAWLAAICVNVARSQARHRRRRPAEDLIGSPEELSTAAPDVFDHVVTRLELAAVARALARLPEPQRVSIVLMDLAGLTAAETAETLGCPRGTVLARVHRGRRRLAGILMAEGIRR